MNILRIKRRAVGGASGAPASLTSSELAYNEQDDILYYGKGNAGGNVASSILPVGGQGAFASMTVSRAANLVLAAPNGSAGAPTFRALVAADIPTLNQNTTGTSSNVTGVVAIANGGSGQTTANLAIGRAHV